MNKKILDNSKLKKIFGDYDNYEIINNDSKYKYYEIPGLTEKINEFLDTKTQFKSTYLEFVNKLSKISNDIFITGSIIHHIFSDKPLDSIDFAFNSTVKDINQFCDDNNLNCYKNIDEKYLHFSQTIKGFYTLDSFLNKPLTSRSYTINNLLYNIKDNVLVDITGNGLEDLLNKKINIPVQPEQYSEWVSNWRYPLLYFKLLSSGFSPINDEQKDFIINYIEKNIDDVYMKTSKRNIPRIKKYIINNISNGVIINNDKYCYGKKSQVILPYINNLKKNLTKETFNKIVSILKEPYCVEIPDKFLERNIEKNKLSYNYRIYRVNKLEEKYNALIEEDVKNMKNSYKNIFKEIRKISPTIYIYGGSIRDLLLDKKLSDVDILFDADIEEVKKLCKKNKWACSKIDEKWSLIVFGSDIGVTLEGHYKSACYMNQKDVDYDFTINRLVYDTKNNLLIDLTGTGLVDLINEHIKIPVSRGKYFLWARTDWKRPLIYFKLKLKGFTPVDNYTEKFIVDYIERNFDKIYMGILYKNGPVRIKHYLIVNLTHGKINEDGSYTVGHNGKRLVPYLDILSKSLKMKYMEQIMKLLKNDQPNSSINI